MIQRKELSISLCDYYFFNEEKMEGRSYEGVKKEKIKKEEMGEFVV